MKQTLAFHNVLTIAIGHSYFEGNMFKSARFELADGATRILKNLGMVVKSAVSGLNCFMTDPELIALSKNDVDPIRIYVRCDDAYHINYTDLPDYDPQHSLVYCNNLPNEKLQSVDKGIDRDDVISISDGGVVLPDDEVEYRFTDALGNPLPKEQVLKLENRPGEYRLTGISEGLVRIFDNDEEVRRIYVVSHKIWKKPLAVIALFPGHFIINGDKKGQRLQIQFNHRNTFWKYFIVNPKYLGFKNLGITIGGNDELFKAPEQTKVMQRPALVFETKEKMPLREMSERPLKLVNRDEIIPELLERLQPATPNQLYRNEENGSEDSLYSHIYV